MGNNLSTIAEKTPENGRKKYNDSMITSQYNHFP